MTRLPSSSLRVPCGTWSAFYIVMAASPTKGNPMIESFGLFSTVMTFAPKRMAVHIDSMRIVIRLPGRRRARGIHSGADLFACSRSLSVPPAKRFCWTNAAVLDTVKWANAVVSASRPSDRRITKAPTRAVPMAMPESLTFCGRTFGAAELELMRQIAREFSALEIHPGTCVFQPNIRVA